LLTELSGFIAPFGTTSAPYDDFPERDHSTAQHGAMIGTVNTTISCKLLAATLFAHEPAAFGEHDSAGLYDHGGPLAASMSTISPG
jgi:hypothetical protein